MVPVETILKEALELPADVRAELVGQLMKTLPTTMAARPPVTPGANANDDVSRSLSWEGGQGFLED